MTYEDYLHQKLSEILALFGIGPHEGEQARAQAVEHLREMGAAPMISRLRLEPGDYPVITYPHALNLNQIQGIKLAWQDLIKSGHRPIVVDGGGQIACILHDSDGSVVAALEEQESCGEEIDIVAKGVHKCLRPKGHKDELAEEGERRHMTMVEYEGTGKKPLFW